MSQSHGSRFLGRLREIVHTSVGGERVRIVLSNVFGTSPLAVGAAHVAIREKEAAIVPKSDRVLTFGGSRSTTIPSRSVVVSDPTNLSVPALADLAIDIYLPGDTATTASPRTIHDVALQTNYVSPLLELFRVGQRVPPTARR